MADSAGLKAELNAKLNLARIARGEELAILRNGGQVRNAAKCRIGGQPIRNCLKHVVEDRVVADVVKLRAKLQAIACREPQVLGQIYVGEKLVRKAEWRARRVAYLPRESSSECKRVEGIRNAAIRIRWNILKGITHNVGA